MMMLLLVNPSFTYIYIIYIYMPLDRPVVALCCGAHFLVCSAEVVFGASRGGGGIPTTMEIV